jgi:hypothetical protein
MYKLSHRSELNSRGVMYKLSRRSDLNSRGVMYKLSRRSELNSRGVMYKLSRRSELNSRSIIVLNVSRRYICFWWIMYRLPSRDIFFCYGCDELDDMSNMSSRNVFWC